jgi:ribokinase
MRKIVVVGSINVDLVTTCDYFPAIGETMFGNDFATFFGGKGANQAVCAAKLGTEVVMVGCVGNDDNGKAVLENLKKHGVNTDHISVVDQPTGVALITVAENDNQIIVIKGANACVNESVVEKAMTEIDQADLVMLQLEIPLTTVQMVIDHCYDKKIPVILNPAPYQDIPVSMIDKATYITPNQGELANMFKGDQAANLAKYPNKLIMTAGKDGVYFHDGEEVIHLSSNKVNVVDTTGAGDTFNGALAVGIANQLSLKEAIIFAQKAASIAIGKMGAQTAMPTLAEMK